MTIRGAARLLCLLLLLPLLWGALPVAAERRQGPPLEALVLLERQADLRPAPNRWPLRDSAWLQWQPANEGEPALLQLVHGDEQSRWSQWAGVGLVPATDRGTATLRPGLEQPALLFGQSGVSLALRDHYVAVEVQLETGPAYMLKMGVRW